MTVIRASDQVVVPRSPHEVWAVIADVRGYPQWWPEDLGLRVVAADANPVGAEVEINPRGGRGFRCDIVAADPPHRMEMRYGGDFIQGTGQWRLEPVGGGTQVTYAIEVRADGWLVKVIGLFTNLGAIHSRQMQGVFSGLKRRLSN